jgi:hypothetical protein
MHLVFLLVLVIADEDTIKSIQPTACAQSRMAAVRDIGRNVSMVLLVLVAPSSNGIAMEVKNPFLLLIVMLEDGVSTREVFSLVDSTNDL